jgi:DNA-binding beta-propeller fold protein YncE
VRRLVIFFALLAAVACAPGEPPEQAAAEPLLLISQKASKTVGWYTLDGELLAEAAVSDHPHEIVLSPDGQRLYVTDNGVMQIEFAGEGGNKVSIIDVPGRKKVGEVDLGEWRRPHGIALCANGTLLATSEAPDQLIVIDAAQQKVVRTFDTGGETPHIVRCSADSTQAYVSNARSRTVARIDLETGERELLETGDRPEGSCLSPDDSTLYVVHRDADKIVAIDTADWSILGEIATPGQPVRCGVSGDGRTIAYGLFAGQAVGFADLSTMSEVGRVATVGPAVSLELTADGETALACAQEQDTCYMLSIPQRSITRTIQVKAGSGPDPMLLLQP